MRTSIMHFNVFISFNAGGIFFLIIALPQYDTIEVIVIT